MSILRISIRYSNNTDTRSNQYLNSANIQYHDFNLAKYTPYFRINSFISVCNYLKNRFLRFCDNITLINDFRGRNANFGIGKKIKKIETLDGSTTFDGKKRERKREKKYDF